MTNIPLAERLRPKSLNDIVGQEHLTGPNGVIRKFIENGTLPSLIFWGSLALVKLRLQILLLPQ